MLQPDQKAQASLSTGVGGVELSSSEARRMLASIESLVATVPEFLADLSGTLGGKVRGELPTSDLIHDVHGISEEALANIVLYRKAGATQDFPC